MIAETAVIVPRLYDYDIAHIFDSANCSYANYIHTAKATWLRLAGDGSTASFLAFAAIEPTMVTENYGPKLGGNPAEYHGLSLKSCANYIPSRDPIFGALRKKHQSHIMRTADAINMSFGRVYQPDIKSPARGVYRVQDRYAQMYAQFHEMVEDVRKKEAVIGNDIGFYEKKCENTGQVLSAFDALREFKERVWPHYGDGIRREYIKEIDSEDEWHSEDEWYSDDEY